MLVLFFLSLFTMFLHCHEVFQIATAVSLVHDSAEAITAVVADISRQLHGNSPSFMVCYCTADHDTTTVVTKLASLMPGVPFMGGTQANGLLNETGWHENTGGVFSLGVFAIWDPNGHYFVGYSPLGTVGKEFVESGTPTSVLEAKESCRHAGACAFKSCLENSKQDDGPINGVWLMTEMDSEEGVLQGISDVFLAGNMQPCALGGGSSGNGDGSQPGCQFSTGLVHQNCVVVAVMQSTAVITGDFGHIFHPTNHSGIVTDALDRHIRSIDGRPAADVSPLFLLSSFTLKGAQRVE